MTKSIIPWSATKGLAQTTVNFPSVIEHFRGAAASTTTWPGQFGVLTLSNAAALVDGTFAGATATNWNLASGTIPSPSAKWPLLLVRARAEDAVGGVEIKCVVGDAAETTGSVGIKLNTANLSYIVKSATDYLESAAVTGTDVSDSEIVVAGIASTSSTAGAFYVMGDNAASADDVVPAARTVTKFGSTVSGITFAASPVFTLNGDGGALIANRTSWSDVILAYLTTPLTAAELKLAVAQLYAYPGYVPTVLIGR